MILLKQVSHSTMKLNSLVSKAREIYNACLNVGSKGNLGPLERDVVSLSQEARPSYEACNLVRHETADVSDILPKGFAQKPYRIATSGYSFAEEGYDEQTLRFLQLLDKILGKKNTAYVTTPALDPKNIYDMTTKVSGIAKDKIMYVTCDRYLPYLKPENFSSDVNLRKFLQYPIHVFPDTKMFVKAAANASNVLVCTGGRTVAVDEIVSALKNKNKIIILQDDTMKNGVFNNERGIVENTAKYFAEITNPRRCGESHPLVDNLDVEWLRAHPTRIREFVRVYQLDNSPCCTLESAVERAARFIKDDFCTYNYIPEDELNRIANSTI